jgi:hypothetical protein
VGIGIAQIVERRIRLSFSGRLAMVARTSDAELMRALYVVMAARSGARWWAATTTSAGRGWKRRIWSPSAHALARSEISA